MVLENKCWKTIVLLNVRWFWINIYGLTKYYGFGKVLSTIYKVSLKKLWTNIYSLTKYYGFGKQLLKNYSITKWPKEWL
jgi:hypothetical protein